jgi:hypothetical protein
MYTHTHTHTAVKLHSMTEVGANLQPCDGRIAGIAADPCQGEGGGAFEGGCGEVIPPSGQDASANQIRAQVK